MGLFDFEFDDAGDAADSERLNELVSAYETGVSTYFDSHALEEIATHYYEQGRFEDALGAIERLVEAQPYASDGWMRRGILQSLLGRHAAALDSYDRALAIGFAVIAAVRTDDRELEPGALFDFGGHEPRLPRGKTHREAAPSSYAAGWSPAASAQGRERLLDQPLQLSRGRFAELDGLAGDTYDLSLSTENVSIDLDPGQGSIFSQVQRPNLGNGRYGLNVYNAYLFEGDERLMNPYGVILVNPAKHASVKTQAGQRFIDWLAQHPVTTVLQARGERIHPASASLANESGHIESESAEHDLHCFQAIRRMDEILVAVQGRSGRPQLQELRCEWTQFEGPLDLRRPGVQRRLEQREDLNADRLKHHLAACATTETQNASGKGRSGGSRRSSAKPIRIL